MSSNKEKNRCGFRDDQRQALLLFKSILSNFFGSMCVS